MKRFVERMLAGLAIGAALAAVIRRTPQTVTESGSGEWADGHTLPSTAVPTAGMERWRFMLKELTSRFREHHTGIVSGSLAYYAFLSLFPSLIAAVAIYGLATDLADLEAQITFIADKLPPEATALITTQLQDIVRGDQAGLGLTAAVSIVLALWSASAGTRALISGVNLAHGLPETRNFVRLRGMALVITLGGALFAAVIAWFVGLVAVAAGSVWQEALLGMTVLVALVVFLGVVYKLAPNRPTVIGRLASPGALAATLLLILTTSGFTVYVTNFGSFGATYGTLAGVIVLLLWFFISAFVVLLGAEVNAEFEQLREHKSREAA